MFDQRKNVIRDQVILGLAGLSHDVLDVDLCGMRFSYGLHHLPDKKIWNQAGIERTGTQRDDVGSKDRTQGVGQRFGP